MSHGHHGVECHGHGEDDADAIDREMTSDEIEEQRHFEETIRAFDDYRSDLLSEISRRERHLKQLSNDHKARLPSITMTDKINELRVAAIVNHKLIERFSHHGNFYCERFNCYIGHERYEIIDTRRTSSCV